MVSEFELLIKDGTIVDGTGRKAFKGSVAVSGEEIVAIGDVSGDAKRVIEADGLTIVPGFVDPHSHADLTLLWYPRCESYVMQGVTTFVGGHCGISPAPLGEYVETPTPLMDYLCELDPHIYYPKDIYPLDQVNEWMQQKFGWTLDWRTMREHFKVVEKKGIAMNYAPLVGHGNVRYAILGEDYKRHSKDSEIEQMIELIHKAMEDGCIGMSTGLDYDPDVFADKEEIEKCLTVIKGYGGIYSPHWRRTGRRREMAMGHRSAERIQGITDVLETAKATGVRMNIAHLYGGYEVSPPPPPALQEAIGRSTLDVIDRYREEGVQVTFDVIPFSPTWGAMPYLCSLLAPWLRVLGSREALGRWLKVSDYREEIKGALYAGKWFIRVAYNPCTNPRWAENIKVVKSKSPGCDGRTIAQIAGDRGKDPLDTLFDIIAEDPESRGAVPDYRGTEDYVKLFFKHPLSMVGVDTYVVDINYQQRCPPYSVPGVNTFSAYPSFLKRNVEENKVLTLEEAVHKTSGLPARIHRLKRRGTLEEGNHADITIIDWRRIRVLGDELEPRKYPKGIEYVFVNGVPVVDEGKLTKELPGRILTRE